jgi:hypothetical protein
VREPTEITPLRVTNAAKACVLPYLGVFTYLIARGRKLAALHDSGVIDDEEFQRMTSRLTTV